MPHLCKLIKGACKLTMSQHEWELSKRIQLHGTFLKSVDHQHLTTHQHARLSGEQHNKCDTRVAGWEGGLSRSGWIRTNMSNGDCRRLLWCIIGSHCAYWIITAVLVLTGKSGAVIFAVKLEPDERNIRCNPCSLCCSVAAGALFRKAIGQEIRLSLWEHNKADQLFTPNSWPLREGHGWENIFTASASARLEEVVVKRRLVNGNNLLDSLQVVGKVSDLLRRMEWKTLFDNVKAESSSWKNKVGCEGSC